MRYSTRAKSSAVRAVSLTPSDSTEPDDDRRPPAALKATLGLYHTPSLPLELTAASQESKERDPRRSTVINLLADAKGLGLELTESMMDRFHSEMQGERDKLAEETPEHWGGQYFQPTPTANTPQAYPPRPLSAHEPQLSEPPTPATAHSDFSSYYQVLPATTATATTTHQHHPAYMTNYQAYPPLGYAESVVSSMSRPASAGASTSTAPAPAPATVARGKGRGKRAAPVGGASDDERERKAEHRRQINRKSARMFRERRKSEMEARESEIAVAQLEIERLRAALEVERAERVRLEGVVRGLRRR